jgi:hypothetical protein
MIFVIINPYWSEKRSDVNDILLIEHLWSLSIAERARLANLEFADSLETEKVVSDIAVTFIITGGQKSKLKAVTKQALATLSAPAGLLTFVGAKLSLEAVRTGFSPSLVLTLLTEFDEKTVARKKIGDDMAVHSHIKTTVHNDTGGKKASGKLSNTCQSD